MQLVQILFDEIDNVYFIQKSGIEDITVGFDQTDEEYQRLMHESTLSNMYVGQNLANVAIEPIYNTLQDCQQHMAFLKKYFETWSEQVDNARKDFEQMNATLFQMSY